MRRQVDSVVGGGEHFGPGNVARRKPAADPTGQLNQAYGGLIARRWRTTGNQPEKELRRWF